MSSFNTLYSCDVIKNGDDASPAGPFLTINAAITYMKNNFSSYLASGLHGTINIGPGTWSETITINTADATRFIDFVGAGINDTIIENTTTGFISIGSGTMTTAENRFNNMTISYTGASTLGNNAIVVQNNNGVVFDNCEITSTQGCIGSLYSPAVISNSVLTSTASNAEGIVQILGGRIANSILTASSLASGGSAIAAMQAGAGAGGYGVLEYCNVTLNTNVETDGIKAGGVLGGVVSYCRFSIGGALSNVGDSYNHLWVKSSCVSSVVLKLGSSGTVDECYFQNTSSSQSSVDFNGGAGTITNSTFLQLSNASDICKNVGNGTQIADASMLNSGSGGYCISLSGSVGYGVAIANIASNCPIDPAATLTDKGLNGTTIGLAKGYSQKRWFAINLNGNVVNSVGCDASVTSGSISTGNTTANGPGVTMTTGSVSGNTAVIQTDTNLNVVRGAQNPSLYVKFSLNQTANTDFWCGLFNAAPSGTTLTSDGAALRLYHTDTDWQYVTYGSSAQHTVSSGIAGDTNTHTLKITLDLSNSRVLFQLDGNTVVSSGSSNIPASNYDLGFIIQIATSTSAAEAMIVNAVWCEYDA